MKRRSRSRPRRSASVPSLVIPIGAAYGVPIDDELVGACRVIAAHPELVTPAGRAVLVAATRWTGTRAQLAGALADARAGEVLRLTHHGWRNKPCVAWATTPPPAEFVALGERPPSTAEQRLDYVRSFVWGSLPLQYRAQLDWEADPGAVRARDRGRARRQDERARGDVQTRPARGMPSGKAMSLAVLARGAVFADWRAPLRTRARARIAKLIAALRSRERSPSADLRAIAACARGFNREREIGTLEAESLDEVLLAIARAVGIDPDTYGRAIDNVRDW